MKAGSLKTLNTKARNALKTVPVWIYPDRQSLWAFLGFKHINGVRPWTAHSKAEYIVRVYEKFEPNLDRIAERIGDNHSTVKRLYRGLRIINQAEKYDLYHLSDRWGKRFAFSHIYTAADQRPFQEFLGIDKDAVDAADTVDATDVETDAGPTQSPFAGVIVFNELLIDADTDTLLDPNNDGDLSPVDDEFIELVSLATVPVSLGRFTISDARQIRFTFPVVTSITPGALKGGLLAVRRHPLREQVLAGGADGQPNLYKIFRTRKRIIGDNFNHIRSYKKLPGRIFDMQFNQDGSMFVVGSSTATGGAARIYKTGTYDETKTNNAGSLQQAREETKKRSAEKALVHDLAGINHPIFAVTFRPDGKQVAVAGFDGHVRLYDVSTGKLVKDFISVDAVSTDTAAK